MVSWIVYSFGAIVMIVGARWIVERSVTLSIEGRERYGPKFVLRGGLAVLFGIMAILIGVYILGNPGVLF